MGRTERGERGELHHSAHRPLEENRQDDDVERRGSTEPRVDPDVVARNLGEQNPLLLLGALADQAFTKLEARRELPALLVAVAGLELQHWFPAV